VASLLANRHVRSRGGEKNQLRRAMRLLTVRLSLLSVEVWVATGGVVAVWRRMGMGWGKVTARAKIWARSLAGSKRRREGVVGGAGSGLTGWEMS